MKSLDGFLALLLILVVSCEAPTQVIFTRPVVVGPGPVFVAPGGGLGLRYQRRNVAISGVLSGGLPVAPFFPGPQAILAPPPFVYGYPPYAASHTHVTVHVVAPTVILGPRPLFPQYEVDLSGVDLDVVGPEALLPQGKIAPPQAKKAAPKPPLARPVEVPQPPLAEVPPKKKDVVKVAPAEFPPKKKDIVNLPPVPPGLPEPKAEPLEESRRLIELGLAAFQAREFGLAAQRFRQAIDVAPNQAQPHFLLTQAYLALGKYKEAVTAIEKGMQRQDDWPLSAFQPRFDLYKGIDEVWFAHKKQLEEVTALHPNQPAYVFLQAYQAWFDGRRDEAAELFRRVKVLAPDNDFADAFLKVFPKVAAK